MLSVLWVPVFSVYPPASSTHIVISGEVTLAGLDAKGNEADGSSYPHEALQTTCQLPCEFDVLWGTFWWSQRIRPIPHQ